MENRINYVGKIFVYNTGMPEDTIKATRRKLEEFGVDQNDIVMIDLPEGIPEGSIMVTIWPHYLSVAKVKLVRDGSIYAPQLFNIEL